jgi:hypothetical protein
MKVAKFTNTHPLWELFIDFHSGVITDRKQRMNAKVLLHPIHYGMMDTNDAFAEALRMRKKRMKDNV